MTLTQLNTNSGTLSLAGTASIMDVTGSNLTNTGLITQSAGTLDLGGTLVTSTLGNITRTGGPRI